MTGTRACGRRSTLLAVLGLAALCTFRAASNAAPEPSHASRAMEGRVIAAADGRPITGAVVTAMEATWGVGRQPQYLTGGSAATQSGTDGSFRFQGTPWDVPHGLRLLRVEAPGFRTCWKVLPPGERFARLDARLVPGGRIEGTVRDAGGKPVPGATIHSVLQDDATTSLSRFTLVDLPYRYDDRGLGELIAPLAEPVDGILEDAYGSLTTTSDEEGRFRLDGVGLGERYRLQASATGHAASVPTVSAVVTHAAVPAASDLYLGTAHRVSIRVVDPDGRPVSALRVLLTVGSNVLWRSAETSRDGIAAFDDLPAGPAHFDIWVGRAHTWRDVDVQAPQAVYEMRTAVAPPGGTVAETSPGAAAPASEDARGSNLDLRLVVPPGVPAPQEVQVFTESDAGEAQQTFRWQPDASGSVLVRPWTPSSKSFLIVLDAEGFAPAWRSFPASGVGSLESATIRLQVGEALAGTILSSTGEPLPRVVVEVDVLRDGFPGRSRDPLVRTAVTNYDGEFVVRGLPSGVATLHARDGRFLPLREAVRVPAPTPSSFRTVDGGMLLVRVSDAGGLPVARRRVLLLRGEGPGGAWVDSNDTDTEGLYRCRVEAGSYRVVLGENPETDLAQGVTLSAGQVRTVSFAVPAR